MSSNKCSNVIAKYLPVYFVLLAIAGVEVFLSFRPFSTGTLVAVVAGGRHRRGRLDCCILCTWNTERRNLLLRLIPATIFVLIMMNMLWSDSFRLLHMKPFAH